jgi:gliding motility-associated-like protein
MNYLKFGFTLLMVSLFSLQSFAQCNTANFTVTKTNGTCFSNGSITVVIPSGQTGCSTRFATLTPVTGPSNTPVTSQTQILLFSDTGGDITFGTLPAGRYNIAVSDGITSTNFANNPVTLTTSYTPMTLTLSSTAPTCSLTSTGYVQNGTFTVAVTGGTGPFDYKLTSAFGVQTVSNGSRTQVFNNIRAGENVTIEVTDKVNGNPGCQVSVTQSYSTSTAVPAPLAYGFRSYNFIRDCGDPLQSKIKFNINLDNLTAARLAILQQPGNAKITIAGVDYPLTYVAARNGFIYDPVAVGGPNLVHNMPIRTTFNWECGILTRTSTVQMPDDWFNYSGATIVAPDCSLKLKLTVIGDKDDVQYYTDRNIYFCPTNSVEIARRISINPDVYQVLSGSDISPDPALTTNDLNVTTAHPTIPSAFSSWTVNEGGYYRITVSDQYHTVVRYYNAGTLTNPLSNVTINPTASVLAGTSGFSFPVFNTGIRYPVTVKVERTDGQTFINHTATEPLNRAGTYTYNFPMFVTWNADPGITGGIYDLPPGEYRFTLTDACSNTKVLTSTNTNYANYTPNYTITQGCNNSNSITFNLNRNGFAFGTNWAPSADVYLYAKNASGGFGNLIQSVARTGNGTATFVNLPSGSYFVQFNGIGLGYSTGERRNSPTSYFKEVVIPNYQNFTVSTGAAICDVTTTNSGIISAQITGGTYTYPITFSLFSTSNPSTPIATHIENNTSISEHSFLNLATGNYFVRVASSCYAVDQNVSISNNIALPQAIVSDSVVCPMSPITLGAISATNGLYDITWTDDADPNQTVIATGMPVVLSPAASIRYRATFRLKDFLACVNPPIYISTVDVRVDPNPDVSLAVSDIELCLAPATKSVTITNSQAGYIYEIVNMNGDSFVPTLSGTGTGGNLIISFPSSFIFAAGTTLKVKTSNGANLNCTDYLTDLITISQSTPIKTLVVESIDVCQGFTSIIKVKASQAQIVYLIKKNGVPISSIPSQTGNGMDLTFTIPANQLVVGVNTFTVQASNSTCGTTDLDQVVTITVTASPVANAGTAFIKTCITNPNGKQIGMTAVSGINYSWSPTIGLDNATIANPIANPTTTTTYTLTASDGNCTATSSVTVTVITTVPSVSAGSDFTKTCTSNASGRQIGSVIQGQNVTYSWTPATGLSSTTIATPIANPSVTTTYTVTATETSSGCASFDEVTVTVNNNLDLTLAVSDIYLCDGTLPAIIISNTQNALSYEIVDTNGVSFSPPLTANGNGGSVTITIPNTITLVAGQVLKIKATNGSVGCTGLLTDICNVLSGTFTITCPTFPSSTVQCYGDLPTQATYTVAQFQALGDGNGIVDGLGCGAVEITAANGANPGCNANVIRNYTVTEYADPNNNDIRDLGENTILKTTSCTQTININDTTLPVVTGTLSAVNASGCSVTDAPAALTTVAELEAAGLTISDNCTTDANLVVTSVDGTASGTCPISFTRTYTITDACNNATTATQTININDTTLPVVTGTLSAVNASGCSVTDAPAALTTVAELEAAGLTISDNCTTDANLVVTSVDGTASGTCPITFTRTYTITDACNNATTATQTININDTTLPVVTGTLSAVNASGCSVTDAPVALTTVAVLEAAGLTISDNCTTDVNLVVTSSDGTASGTCPITFTRTYTITDACNNATTATQTININDTTLPVVTGTLSAVNASGCSVTDAPVALTTVAALEAAGLTISDNCTTDANLVVTSVDGTASGTCPISFTRTYTITDACNNATTATQTININDTTLPVVTGTLSAVNASGCSVTDAPAVLTTVAELEAAGLTILDNCTTDANLVVTSVDGTATGTCPISFTRTYTITDACNNATTATQTININDTTLPVVTGTLSAVNASGCSVTDAPVALTTVAALEAAGLTISDNCTTDANLVVTSSDGTASGTCPITFTRTYTITDACNNATTATQTININDTTLPVVTGTLSAVNASGCSVTDAPVALTSVVALEAAGLTILDNCTTDVNLVVTSVDGTASGTCPITFTRTYTITDACNNATTATQTININDTTAPIITSLVGSLDVTLECSDATAIASALNSVPIASDNCASSLQIHLITDTTTISSLCANTYIRTRVWNFTDGCSNLSNNFTQIITIQDDTKPNFTGQLPQNLTLECNQIVPSAAVLSATDNCNGIVTIDFEEQTIPGTCPSNKTILRTWTATDICGNFETHSQEITIEDNTPPTFDQEIRTPELYAKCDAIPAPQEFNAVDLCGTATVSYNEVNIEGDCTNKYRIERTWRATDSCGNFREITQTLYLACDVEVFNAVSPDGDGLNDYFRIEGLECYPNNTVEIYNRWGVKVYETSSYDNFANAFKGFSDGRTTLSRSEKLPTGTYWYILKYEYDLYGTEKENKQKIGYLYIQNE